MTKTIYIPAYKYKDDTVCTKNTNKHISLTHKHSSTVSWVKYGKKVIDIYIEHAASYYDISAL